MNAAMSQVVLSDRFMKNASMAVLAVIAVLATGAVVAGTGTGANAFAGAVNMITTWLSGTLGVLIALAVFTTGVMVTVTQHTLMPVAVAAATALAISVGPAVLSGMFTAVL